MDSKVIVTVLTILFYVFSTTSPAPENNTLPYETNSSEEIISNKIGPYKITPVSGDNPASVKELARIRKGPGTDYPVLQRVSQGTQVKIVASHNEWYQVKLPDENTGWIAKFLISSETVEDSREIHDVERKYSNGNKNLADEMKTEKKRMVVGYYTEDYEGDPMSYSSLLPNKDSLDYIAIFSHPVTKDGRVSGKTSTRAIEAAKSGNVQALALVHNFVQGRFDSKRAHVLLQSYNSRAKAISDILDILESQGYNGVNIDLENIDPQDRNNLTDFIAQLQARLKPHGYLVTMSVPAKTRDHQGQPWVGAFDYYALGKACDYLMLMTYDEHSQVSKPGPIASLPWVERVIKYAITQVPKDKIIMGVPAYGYDWNLSTKRVVALSYVQIMNRATRMGIDPSWDANANSPFYRYIENGAHHEVWFESPESLRPKLDLVEKYDISGIAIWKLGYENNQYWKTIINAFED